MELIAAINKLWEYPQKEYLLLYNSNGSKVRLTTECKEIFYMFGFNSLDPQQIQISPILIFLYLINNKYFVEKDEYALGLETVQQIQLNKYQQWKIEDQCVEIVLKLPKIVSPYELRNFEYKEYNITRPPQLRRTLMQYCDKHNVIKNDLKQQLLNLGVNNPVYSYEDADEIAIYDPKYYADTYIEMLPKELKDIIVEYIESFNYLSNEKELPPKDKLLSIIDDVTQKVKVSMQGGQDMSIIDIFNDINQNGGFGDINELMRSRSPVDLLNHINNEIGFSTIIENIKNNL